MTTGRFIKQSHALMESRREFLRRVGMNAAAASMVCMSAPFTGRQAAASPLRRPKLVLVTFGGGARDDETFSLAGQENIPYLLNELAPQSTFFPQVINRGILGHYVATASIATGAYETFDNFVSQHPSHPTLFEYFRKDLGRSRDDAWVIAPSNGFEALGSSTCAQFGDSFGAHVVLPKRLLAAAADAGRSASLADYEALLRDSYENPSQAPAGTVDDEVSLDQLCGYLRLSRQDLLRQALSMSSPDELSVFIATRLMREVAPSVLVITLHDIDIAHTGAFSLYLEGIRRSDRLCAELWRTVQQLSEYSNRTTMLILPDFGRDADDDLGGNGFQHHRTGSAMARTTWMLALGVNARPNSIVSRPLESVDLVPTIGRMLGFDARYSTGHVIEELL